MTADGTPGAKNQPQFLGTGAPATAADLNTLADHAASVGNLKVLTTAQRTALSGSDRWTGLLVADTDLSSVFIYLGGWVRLWASGATPYAVAQGTVTCPNTITGDGGVTGSHGYSDLIDVTFPVGRFSVAPHVYLSTIGPSGQIVWSGMAEQVTSSGCKVRGGRVGSAPNNLFSVKWIAVQMTSASAVG